MALSELFKADHDTLMRKLMKVVDSSIERGSLENANRALETAMSLASNVQVFEQQLAAAAAQEKARSPRIAGMTE